MVQLLVGGDGYSFVGNEMFGGNILSSRDTLDDTTNFTEAVNDLGITSLRYPGGSLTEYCFDISDPNSTDYFDDSGNFEMWKVWNDLIPLTDFMDYASENDLTVSIVLPTRTSFTSTTDSNGDRWAAIDEDELRSFVRSVLDGTYGQANVTSFELGNEYWGSGEMSAVEYGRVAAAMSSIIQSELDNLAEEFPDANGVKIICQTGQNYGQDAIGRDYTQLNPDDALDDINARYGLDLGEDALFRDGSINWTHVTNELIQAQFDDAAFAAIDGISVHLYTNDGTSEGAVDFNLGIIEQDWLSVDGDRELHVTEWNQTTTPSDTEAGYDRGLWTAQEVLETFDQMVGAGVSEANIWPVLQNTSNALAYGSEYTELSPVGEMFSLMSETLPGKAAIDLVDNTENSLGDLYLYYGHGEAVAYFAANQEITVSGLWTARAA